MQYRIAIILLGAGYVAYRISLAVQILQAKRAGDLERERRLRTHGFGLYRWAAGAVLVLLLVLVFLIWANAR
jgi:hypothetical protein